ncbi:hypothetical protein N7452_003096 [Penicillium brevicompactum]|uniref:Uncharacterized protein n=1 Tax=Penicillium brevicompactum TaxID=5074 RepID=A0A9W9QT57_PENBR|nr:hypothetical protein N7452_003096 [Penicillium brevicompactum]
MQFFFPKKHRNHKLVLWLMAGEFPITIVMLTLTGIASHNLYRTLLWQDGADNGFNSAPNEALYAAANYRPFTAPMVWSGFITNYNLVLGVLSTFFLIVKLPVHWMHLFYPPVAVSIHASLIILYLVSAIYQGGSDTSDPKHSQSGPPWYITKSCSVAYRKSNIPYCMQAKALFAVTILMIPPGMIPMTPGSMPHGPGIPPMAVGGTVPPFASRTLAFNRLDNSSTASDLPLRSHQAHYPSPQSHEVSPESANGSPMYFPPPPKKAART